VQRMCAECGFARVAQRGPLALHSTFGSLLSLRARSEIAPDAQEPLDKELRYSVRMRRVVALGAHFNGWA